MPSLAPPEPPNALAVFPNALPEPEKGKGFADCWDAKGFTAPERPNALCTCAGALVLSLLAVNDEGKTEADMGGNADVAGKAEAIEVGKADAVPLGNADAVPFGKADAVE